MTPQDHLEPTPIDSLDNAEHSRNKPSCTGAPYPHPYAHSSSKHTREKVVKHTAVALSGHMPVDHSSESGTEADDESGVFFKGLPAPPERPHKGLRTNENRDEGISPLVTPHFLQAEQRTLSADGLKRIQDEKEAVANEERLIQKRYAKRKRGELVRRTVEVCLLAAVAVAVCHEAGFTILLDWWQGKD